MKFSDFEKGGNLFSSKRLKRAVVDTTKNLDRILKIVRSLNNSLILNDVLKLVLENAISISNSDRGFIVLKDDSDNLKFELGLDAEGNRLRESSFEISRSTVDEVFHTGLSKFVEHAQDDRAPDSSGSIFALELQTILCSPLIIDDKKIGVIYVDSKNMNNIHAKDITDMFEILAGQAAIAIKNAQLYRGRINAYEALQRTNQELLLAKKKAEESDKLKTEFLAQISHEIRTPINVIQNFPAILRECFPINSLDTLESELQGLETATKRIVRTMDLILNISEIYSGTYEPHFEKYNLLKDILEPAFFAYKNEAEQKGLRFSLDKTFQDCLVVGDIYSVQQIFNNIINNAVKFTKEGFVEINLREGGNEVIVEVTDSGVGIKEDYIKKIFDPFSQEHQGYSRKFEGNGLGLTLVKHYCDLNGYKIRIGSLKGNGTTVVVAIPKA